MGSHVQGIIASKVAPPALPERLIDRPRLEQRLADLIGRHRLLWVRATAGSGKTTAVARAVASLPTASCWLTVDDTEAAPGRLLVYLDAALAPHLEGRNVVQAALSQGRAHREAAGLLVESLKPSPVVLVLDELERLAESPGALDVLDAMIRYAPTQLRMVLISRCDLPLPEHPREWATIDERALSFDREEAVAALEVIGARDIDADTALEVTGGWVTGVLFEAWRSEGHVAGTGGGADPLHGYLAREILDRLAADERGFLITTALLAEVTAESAEALGETNARSVLARLRSLHLPVTWARDGTAMRCHPRLREYLLQLLERREGGEVRRLRVAHADLLARCGREEEATEEYLRAQEIPRALPLAERTIGTVIERLDLAVAEHWLALFGEASHRSLQLLNAHLTVLIAHERYDGGAALGDRLAAEGRMGELGAGAPALPTLLAWCYWHVGRPDDARRVLAASDDGPEGAVGRYLLTLVDDRADVAPPPPTRGPLDEMVNRVHWARGHLRRLEAARSRLGEIVGEPWHINALLWLGRMDEAQALYERAIGRNRGFWLLVVGVELALARGRVEEALNHLGELRTAAGQSGSVVYETWALLLELRIAMRDRDDPQAAHGVLERLDAVPRLYPFIAEQVAVWRGVLALRAGDQAAAHEHLAAAVAGMTAGDRLLELSTAAVYLSEVRWRLGDEDGADEAAELALATAQRQGSASRLLLALRECPAVLARQLDRERVANEPWHEVARAFGFSGMLGDGRTLAIARLRVIEFGQTAIELDGELIKLRLRKSEELIAYLAHCEDGSATKEELLGALFEGRGDRSTRSYLRQILLRLRQALPQELAPSSEGDLVRIPTEAVMSESAEFERLLAQAMALDGESRLTVLNQALEIAERGPYLAETPSEWARTRASELTDRLGDARFEAASVGFQIGRYDEADRHLGLLLEEDPYREQAWRLSMSLADARGDGDRVIQVWLRCRSALRELGIEPSNETEQHFEMLRGVLNAVRR